MPTELNFEEQLIRDEGEILHAYKDSLGYLTIGVGHLIDQRMGGSIPKSISRELLQLDIQKAKTLLVQDIPWIQTIDCIRQEVLVNMTFNLGIAGLLAFVNTLSLVKNGNYDEAADAMLASRWAGQVKGRAARLAEQMRTGVRQ